MRGASRRSFLKLVATAPVLSGARSLSVANPEERPVKLYGDGLGLSPREYVDVLSRIVEEKGIEEDDYSRGGVVEELEETMAAALGKERAIYFATGTLANHVALRVLAGERKRVIVPYDSHVYNDSGDCAQQLSQLNLVPLASDTATFTLEQVREIVARTSTGRVETGVGALLIESPVRRKLGETFDYEEMKRISSFARDNGIKTHLDGARLYMASGFSGISPREYASHFDTVYVSLWKYFNAASGAILAGPREVIDELYHMRRMFGGGLPAAWPFAAVVLHYFASFEADFAAAVRTAKNFFSELRALPSFDIGMIPNGSNIFRMAVRGTDPRGFRDNLRTHGVLLPPPRGESGEFLVTVNATWNRTDAGTLAEKFKASI
jgi:threonine aldolase